MDPRHTSSQSIRAIERESFLEQARDLMGTGARLVFMYATDDRATRAGFSVNAVFDAHSEGFVTLRALVPAADPTYPSLASHIMAAHWYERLIHDQFGIVAQGHPDWRRLVHHENIPAKTHPLRKDFAWNTALAHTHEPYPMHAVEGKGVYEIPVGPIHAGIIEPGHFRFNVRGERILTLEGKLFFTHKGVEKLVEGKTPAEALPFVERISGDGAVGHALAFCEAVERATGTQVPDRARELRVLWLELERVGAHLFDLGNMGGMGTGFTFMAAQCFRMLEDMRLLYASLTGHRFLRGAVMPGGAHDLDTVGLGRILAALDALEPDISRVLDIAYATDGLMERFETTGVLTKDAALAYGARGVPARASGVDIDMRRDHPTAAYKTFAPHVPTKTPGDVRARFSTRVIELAESIRLIRAVADKLTKGPAHVPLAAKPGESLGWCESFRGAIIDFVCLDEKGRIERLAVSDPSFMNWALFGELGPGNIVPDFPLCNKSLNLSYSGTDL
ncbi:NADH-quinone oxidoreductase subunit F [Candidatus Kaiserbacteria bacterium]|nr:NADH-quinone oxidoreductase subunit F [Candidatus Kaiserbacteria bacterium]